MVSGMLTAIRDFVGDSFHVRHEDGVDAIRLGDLSVQVRVGPQSGARGGGAGQRPRTTLRVQLSETLERIHRSHAVALKRFDGNTAAFASTDRVAAAMPYRLSRESKSVLPWRAYVLLGLIVVLIAVWAGIARQQRAAGWNGILDELEHEPGLVVLESSRARSIACPGLRDPLARDPHEVIGAERAARYGIVWDWKPYLSMEPPFCCAARSSFEAAALKSHYELTASTLRASGTATDSWLREARSRAPFIPGVRVFDDGAVRSGRSGSLDQARQTLTSAALYFDPGSDALSDEQRAN